MHKPSRKTSAPPFTGWAAAKGIVVRYIQPGKPNQNAFIERFNRTYRTEVLDAHLFANLEQVQAMTEQWLVDYNEYRPHEVLGDNPRPESLSAAVYLTGVHTVSANVTTLAAVLCAGRSGRFHTRSRNPC